MKIQDCSYLSCHVTIGMGGLGRIICSRLMPRGFIAGCAWELAASTVQLLLSPRLGRCKFKGFLMQVHKIAWLQDQRVQSCNMCPFFVILHSIIRYSTKSNNSGSHIKIPLADLTVTSGKYQRPLKRTNLPGYTCTSRFFSSNKMSFDRPKSSPEDSLLGHLIHFVRVA